jgi:hypothetical protein
MSRRSRRSRRRDRDELSARVELHLSGPLVGGLLGAVASLAGLVLARAVESLSGSHGGPLRSLPERPPGRRVLSVRELPSRPARFDATDSGGSTRGAAPSKPSAS